MSSSKSSCDSSCFVHLTWDVFWMNFCINWNISKVVLSYFYGFELVLINLITYLREIPFHIKLFVYTSWVHKRVSYFMSYTQCLSIISRKDNSGGRKQRWYYLIRRKQIAVRLLKTYTFFHMCHIIIIGYKYIRFYDDNSSAERIVLCCHHNSTI